MLELKKHTLKQNMQKGTASTQVTLDEDCIVKDNKPDVIQIIHTRGNIVFEEVKVSSQNVWVTGKLQFTVLYRSDGNRVETFSDVVNFGEKIFMDEVDELDTVQLRGKLEDLSISAINSRKLAIRAVVDIRAVCEQMTEEELASAVEGDENVQQKRQKQSMLLLVTSQKDILRTHNELSLPGASPNIGNIIYYNVDIRNKGVTLSNDRVQLQGEAYVSVLYNSVEGQTEWYETMVPFNGSMDCNMAAQQPLYWICSRPSDMEVEAIGDYDGEMRNLSLDMTFDVNMKIWQEEDVEILEDVYSLRSDLSLQTEKMNIWRLLVKNEAVLRISQQMKLEEKQERILQLCSYEGSVDVDRVEPRENGLLVEGVVSVHILYATTDDSFPVAHSFEQIPFSQMIEVPGMDADAQGISYELEPGIEQLSVNLLDNERYEIKGSVLLAALVLKEDCVDKIVSLQEEPFDVNRLGGQPGVTGYMVQEKEELWDIAKRFHTTEKEIVSTNGLKSAKVMQGEKLIIVKCVR